MFLHCFVDGMLWVDSCRMKQSPVYNLEPVFCQPVQRSGRRIKASKLRLIPPKTVGTKKKPVCFHKKKNTWWCDSSSCHHHNRGKRRQFVREQRSQHNGCGTSERLNLARVCVRACVFVCFVNSSLSDFIVLVGSPLIFHSWHFLVIPTAAQDLRCLTL